MGFYIINVKYMGNRNKNLRRINVDCRNKTRERKKMVIGGIIYVVSPPGRRQSVDSGGKPSCVTPKDDVGSPVILRNCGQLSINLVFF